MEAEKICVKTGFSFITIAGNRENVVVRICLLIPLNKLIGLQMVYGFARILFVVRCMNVVYLTTKMIQVMPYTICRDKS